MTAHEARRRPAALTSGDAEFDALIDEVHIGDNLVVVADDDADVQWLVDAFVGISAPDRLVIGDTTGRHRGGLADRVLDWTRLELDGDGGPEQELADADREVGTDARVVVDSLTDVARSLGPETALGLFLTACPRLYRRRSIALWVVQRQAHDPGFLRRLTDVTQVVVNVRSVPDGIRLEVAKADGRPPSVVGRKVEMRLAEDGQPDQVHRGPDERSRLAEVLRRLRTTRGLTQAEVARQVGISPSALSQAERGVSGLSGETVLGIWDALGIPVDLDRHASRGYAVARRGARRDRSVAPGVTGQLLADAGTTEVWELIVAGGSTGRGPIFSVKAPETVLVRDGVFSVETPEETVTLQAGDSLSLISVTVAGWANPSHVPARLIWILAH